VIVAPDAVGVDFVAVSAFGVSAGLHAKAASMTAARIVNFFMRAFS
jgi:hypothetical protein